MKMKLPSQFQIGDPVYVKVNENKIEGNIRVVLFTTSKVRYSVIINLKEDDHTTFHNLDSCFVTPRDGEKVKFNVDNYS